MTIIGKTFKSTKGYIISCTDKDTIYMYKDKQKYKAHNINWDSLVYSYGQTVWFKIIYKEKKIVYRLILYGNKLTVIIYPRIYERLYT